MNDWTASCACGQLNATATGAPVRISICHCLDCKRRTGSAFGLQSTWTEEQVAIRGEAREFERFGDDGGNWVREYFCGRCGVRVFYRIELRPGMVSIPVGAFADPGFPPPTVEVYGERAQAGIGRQLGEDCQE
ncbi:MAG: GFA family protein [Sphingomicrobium sp.]